MSKPRDLTGQRFGRLVAIEPTEERKNGHVIWRCKCSCGNICFVKASHLLSKNNQSCGCLHVEQVANLSSLHHIKHNFRNSRLYRVWASMKDRCYNSNIINYKNYGGRGITVCDEWRNDFQAFHDWAMANGYDENAPRGQCTLDRINVDGNYCPDNCRWVDMKTQASNKRNSKNKEVEQCLQ